MRVLRWVFDVDDQVDLRIPEQSRLLKVEPVGIYQIELWTLGDENAPIARRRLRIAGTGHPIDPEDTAVYVGTTVSGKGLGRLVWHVFDLGEILG